MNLSFLLLIEWSVSYLDNSLFQSDLKIKPHKLCLWKALSQAAFCSLLLAWFMEAAPSTVSETPAKVTRGWHGPSGRLQRKPQPCSLTWADVSQTLAVGYPFLAIAFFKAMCAITFCYTVINLLRNTFIQNVEREMYKWKAFSWCCAKWAESTICAIFGKEEATGESRAGLTCAFYFIFKIMTPESL